MTSQRAIGFGLLGAILGLAIWGALEVSGLAPDSPLLHGVSPQSAAARERAIQSNEIAQIIAARSDEIFRDPATPVGVNPLGDVSLVEFFDYNCPYCRLMAPTLVELQDGDPGLRVVYKDWPILGPKSEFAARAALASRNQGKYVAFHKALMRAGGLIDQSKALEVAALVGLDVDRLKREMQAPEIMEAVARNQGSCPGEWCKSARRLFVSGGLGRLDQAAVVVSLMS